MECNFENCGYYIDGECSICGMGTDGEDTFCKYCKNNPNCYYKQLAELKELNKNLMRLNASNAYDIGNFLRENEQLKTECEMYKTFYRAKHSDIKGLLFKYRQTLQEVKEMILYCEDEYNCDKCRYHDKCQPDEGEFPDFSKALLQKIAECEVK